MILTKLGQHVNEMIEIAVKNFKKFLLSSFLIIGQNVNMATNAIRHCGLNNKWKLWSQHDYKIFICLCFGRCC